MKNTKSKARIWVVYRGLLHDRPIAEFKDLLEAYKFSLKDKKLGVTILKANSYRHHIYRRTIREEVQNYG